MIQNIMSTPAANVTAGSKPYIVEDRPMISRSSGDRVKITHTIEPGKDETGCLTCFYSPPDYPILAKCPCYDYPEYIVNEINSSRYIYIRENSIEYNQPTLQPAKAENALATVLCCGNSPTSLIVRDQISTIYFDDILMDGVRNDTRPCNPLHTFCCGGRGEEVRLESRFCWDSCYRGRGIGTEQCGPLNCIFHCCVPCVPVVCPDCLCPCAARKTIYVEDAETAVKIISKARDDARIRMQVIER
ncbi:hypothetical protein ACHAXA_005912 [Cyclostephanos tholiformis]|uniref:Phospholipid scramblase n=1 Tax=Cyclostephanos tholiformis TaxID=382380 RepID=A0ABD3SCK8_9STRA